VSAWSGSDDLNDDNIPVVLIAAVPASKFLIADLLFDVAIVILLNGL
jgi:hypothetical protein